MARARNIKPGFFTNDLLAEASPLARILFAGLWCFADREGRLFDRPKKIKAEILPYDNCNADDLLQSLAELGFIQRYEVAGIRYIQVVNFDKHQNPHIKEQASEIPAPSLHQTCTSQQQVNTDESTEVAGLIPSSLIPDSLIPIETPPATPSGSADGFVLPDWIPAETWKAYCKTRTGKKAKNDPHALGLIVADLEKFKALGHDPVEILNNSIKGGWAGVFEPKQNSRASPNFRNIHDDRANTIAVLTGRKANDRTINERDITGESERVA